MGGLIKIAIFSLTLAILIYPGLEKLYLYRQTIKFEDLVMAPFGFLGKDQTILSDLDRFSRYNTKYTSLELLNGNNLAIGIKNEFKFHEKWVNLTKERERVYDERLQGINESYTSLLNNTYSMIVYGPPVTSGDLASLVYRAGWGDPEYVESQGLCALILFSPEQKCNDCQFMLAVDLDKESCENSIGKLNKYYNDNFGKYLAIEGFRNYITIDGKTSVECKSGGSLLKNYTDHYFRLRHLLNIIYLSVALFLIINFNKIKSYFKKSQSM